jgi:hypothetical protein
MSALVTAWWLRPLEQHMTMKINGDSRGHRQHPLLITLSPGHRSGPSD